MHHSYEKRYYECLAKLILENYLPGKFNNIELSDQPDLRMGDEYGIEVTRALYIDEAQASGIFKHLANSNIKEVDARHIETMKRLGAKLLIHDDGKIYGFCPSEGVWINDNELRREYQKKVEKYHKNNYSLRTVDLFIYSPLYDWLEEDIIRGFMQWIDEKKDCPFNNIMVFEYSYLYLYNTAAKEFEKISVDIENHEKLHSLRELALSYSEKDG